MITLFSVFLGVYDCGFDERDYLVFRPPAWSDRGSPRFQLMDPARWYPKIGIFGSTMIDQQQLSGRGSAMSSTYGFWVQRIFECRAGSRKGFFCAG